jgi:hypothetical protein
MGNVPNYDTRCNSNFKAYMSYKAVTQKSSPQWKTLNSSEAYTDPETGIRAIDGRYFIALGTFYNATIGQKVDVQLESGYVIPCIVGDIRANAHSDPTRTYSSYNGGVIEFIVDMSVFGKLKDKSGTVNWCKNGAFKGKIVNIDVLI